MLDLSVLNIQQRKAVETTEGAVLVLAGAGSGKTKALTYRIAYIVDTGLASPQNILAMTFTNKAAAEMRERIEKLTPDSHQLSAEGQADSRKQVTGGFLWMGTFHSICVKILKREGELIGLGRNFSIYDSSDQDVAIKEAMKNLNISTKEFNPRAIKNYISSAKNELIDSEAYESFASGYFQGIVAQVYPEYQKILKQNNACDFDDLIMFTVKLFKENPEVLKKYQERFKYILVDEYQDTNHAQYILISMLANLHKNICCVGDDDQSIYAFRGATIKNILNFEKDYPDCEIIKLEQNYRSTKKILEASYNVISKNKSRKDKKLWTDNLEGENITVYTARNEVDEAKWVTDKITEISKNCPLSDIAILYRTNAQSRSLEEAFLQSAIPYKIVGGFKFYERKEIKDIISYLRLIYNPRDNKNLERIINVPKRGIGDKTLADLNAKATESSLSPMEFLLKAYQADLLNSGIKEFAAIVNDLINKSKTLNVVELINYVLERTGYIKFLSDGTLENESRIENLKELVSVASRYEGEEPLIGLEMFLDEVSLLQEAEERTEQVKETVTLMTIHAAKGLEFKYVFVVGVEENLFPHSNSILDQKELEEERRLAYVAITRAKEKLFLTHATTRLYFGSIQSNPVSRFINDIEDKFLEFEGTSASSNYFDNNWDEVVSEWKNDLDLSVGDRVKHNYFGIGKIIRMDDEFVEIDFGAVYGVKELMLEYAKLERLT